MANRVMRVSGEKTDKVLCRGTYRDQVPMKGNQLERGEEFMTYGSTVQKYWRSDKELAKIMKAEKCTWGKVKGRSQHQSRAKHLEQGFDRS